MSGLTLGGDDYVTKPFSLDEVLARIRAVLRRTAGAAAGRRGAAADLRRHRAGRGEPRGHQGRRGRSALSPTEFKLLRYLMANAGRVLSKAQILDHVWNYDFNGEANVVESYISYLRRKIDTTEPRLLHTIRGVGYTLRLPRGSVTDSADGSSRPSRTAASHVDRVPLRITLVALLVALVAVGLLVDRVRGHVDCCADYLLEQRDAELRSHGPGRRARPAAADPATACFRPAPPRFPSSTYIACLPPKATTSRRPAGPDARPGRPAQPGRLRRRATGNGLTTSPPSTAAPPGAWSMTGRLPGGYTRRRRATTSSGTSRRSARLVAIEAIVGLIVLAVLGAPATGWCATACGRWPRWSAPPGPSPRATSPGGCPRATSAPRSAGWPRRSTACCPGSRPPSAPSRHRRSRPAAPRTGCGGSWPTPATSCGPR